ncbi:monosaccharide ABC transporter substrate-binding protein (CUT2 family) [Anaerobacterium chartisolvens]|uniref:Monosaccharide ABC transporter substrate-binding protein (CUT2 family) n=1 Tax=Anaerobacterium chartisolvens TaxID=1297424 RepID=A0A369B4X5_9FIRM|nr:sugar ABC transporter substrate-binding protein [Anaerobacterium chartisolvens]RCX16543.1 monosaccharide ABC transporter substrate-binding protein (CUT2 family) [Anaerobacterium chartisolvens]
MKKLAALILAVSMVSMVLFSGCGSSSGADSNGNNGTQASSAGTQASKTDDKAEGKKYVVGGVIMNMAWPWFLGTQVGMEQYAREKGLNVEFQFEDSQNDIQTQIKQLENMAQKGVDGIVIFPVDSKAIIPTMVDLHKNKQIKFVVGDYAQNPDSKDDIVWETFVGHDFKAMGTVAGQIAVKEMKAQGKTNPTCVYLSLPKSGEASVKRFEGFKEAVLAELPDAKIIEEGDSTGDRSSSQTLFENVLQRSSDIDIVCGHNDALVVGAYNAAVGANAADKMKFIGMAGDKEVIQYLADGNKSWIGEVLQDPVVLGYTAMEALVNALDGKKLPDNFDLPAPEALTPENIGQKDWKSWTWLGN